MELNRGEFLNLAGLVEGGLAVAAFGLAWAAGFDPLQLIGWNWTAAAWGLAACLPMFVLFAVTYRFPFGPLRDIKRFLIETLGAPLAACRWYDLALLGLIAGFSEELLFRGVLQPWIERSAGLAAAIVGSNLLFGLSHAITKTYAVLAGCVGVYLGLLLYATGPANLLPPMIAHSLYDFLAFAVVARDYRSQAIRLD